ncbi:hypothetical protein RM11_1146 [Bartonella quintana RM-11]|nr:hypothetical protein RM11_1146 [Bartonella quintana RM-11]
MFLRLFTLLLPLQKRIVLCHILNTIIDNFRLFIIKIEIMMNISLSRRYALNHEELLICASDITTVSSFSSIAETDKRIVKTSLYFYNSHGPAVEGAYKSSFYKLWQDLIKDKPSTYNDGAFHSYNKKHSHIKRVSTLYQPYPERVRTAENYMMQSPSRLQQKQPWFKYFFFFYNLNDYPINWRDTFGFVSDLCTVKYILTYVKNIFGKNKSYRLKKQSPKLNKFTWRIYSNIVWRHLEKTYRIDFYIDKFFHHRVYCS